MQSFRFCGVLLLLFCVLRYFTYVSHGHFIDPGTVFRLLQLPWQSLDEYGSIDYMNAMENYIITTQLKANQTLSIFLGVCSMKFPQYNSTPRYILISKQVNLPWLLCCAYGNLWTISWTFIWAFIKFNATVCIVQWVTAIHQKWYKMQSFWC